MDNTTRARGQANSASGKPTPLVRLGREFRQHYVLYLMALPGIAYFVIFQYYPMYGAIIAFKNYQVLQGFIGSPWVGFQNFEAIFQSTYFTNVLANTVLISVYKIVLGLPPAVIMALLINEVRFKLFKNSVQTITYLPHFLSWIIIYGVLQVVLSPSSGLANKAIVGLGGDPINFLADLN